MVSIRRRRNRQGSATSSAVEPPLPEGWSLADHVKPNGEVVKCYTNVIGQNFFTMEDLMRYVEYAKREQLSIYKPGFDSSQLADTSSENESDFLDSSKEEEKRNELNKASAADPPVDSKPKKQGGEGSTRKKSRSSTKISNHVDEKLDENATSSKEGKAIATSSVSKPIPLRASRRLAGCDPEIVPADSCPEKASQLQFKNDLISSGDQGDKLASRE